MSKHNSHISEKVIKDYLQGRLSATECHTLEKKALTDQYLWDRLNGADEIKEQSVEMTEVSASLQKRLAKRLQNEKRHIALWIRNVGIAAGILLIGGFSWFIIDSLNSKTALAQVEQKVGKTPKPSEKAEQEVGAGRKNEVQSILKEEGNKQKITAIASAPPFQKEKELRKPSKASAPITSDEEEETEALFADEILSDAVVNTPEPTQLEEVIVSSSSVRSKKALPPPVSPPKKTVLRAPAGLGKPNTTKLITKRGRVTDELGDGIPGVYIQSKATKTGYQTDENGNFEIPILNEPDLLTFSFIGYESKSMKTDQVGTEDIILVSDQATLSEVVVIADDFDSPILNQKVAPEKGWKFFNQSRKIKDEKEGRIKVELSISENGELGNIRIVESFDPDKNDVVLKILENFKEWKPEISNGKAQPIKRRFTFKFQQEK